MIIYDISDKEKSAKTLKECFDIDEKDIIKVENKIEDDKYI